MIIYEKLSQYPQAARNLLGMSLLDFDKLYADFLLAHTERRFSEPITRRSKLRRQRAVGGGPKYKYSLRDRLVMTLFWLRAPMSYEVFSCFYELDKTNIEDNLKDVLATLDRVRNFSYEHQKDGTKKLRSVAAVMDAFPDIHLVLDTQKWHYPISKDINVDSRNQ